MQRPPPQPWQYGFSVGSGAGGYSYPAQFLKNPNFQSPANTQYYQQPASFPPAGFQNPSILQAQNPFISGAGFPTASPSSIHTANLEAIDRAAAKVHQDLVNTGVNVSSWKVSQKALAVLKADSWNLLGFHLHDVPTLQRLFAIEGKVDAFIHCYVCGRKITSMYELEVSLCKNMGVGEFEKLGLGPFLCQPLIQHYFAISSDLSEVFKITSEEIILSLQEFIYNSTQKVSAEKFLMFLSEQKSVPVMEKLGVRIRDIGLHVHLIRDANKAEYNHLKQKLDRSSMVGLGDTNTKAIGKKNGSQRPNFVSEKQILDKRFDYISSCVNSFSSMWSDSSDKHVCFISSDEEYDSKTDDVYDKMEDDGTSMKGANCQPFIPPVKSCGQATSSCPYPSKSEEMVRLGLKPIEGCHNSSTATGPSVCKEIMNPFKRKRKRKLETDNSLGPPSKCSKSIINGDLKAESQMCDVTLTNGDMEKFVATWKGACGKHSLSEILDMMLKVYLSKPGKRKWKRNMFTSYPFIGLFNVAVMSIKRGIFTSIYDAFQGLNQTDSSAFEEMIDVGPHSERSHKTITIDCGCSVSQDDIIKKIIAYFESNKMTQEQRGLSPEKHLETFKKLFDCQMSLLAQFNAKEFCALGHGTFYDFLEKHISVLPLEMQSFLGQELYQGSSVEIYLNQQQICAMQSQAEGNLMPKADASSFDTVSLLKKQFPTVSFRVTGMDPHRYMQGLINEHKESSASTCVLFSTCLLGQKWNQSLLICKENSVLNTQGTEVNLALQHAIRRTSKDAVECLLKTPMLEDLLYWSHWDLLYAPLLGPLSDFLLNKVNSKSLLCIATVNGKFIRVDHTATVDDFLEAFVQCSSFCIALKLLSLICLYRGTNNAPLALLKCYAQKAVDVIVQNSVDSVEINAGGKNFIQKKIVLNKRLSSSCVFADCIKENHEISEQSTMCNGLCRVNDAISTISKTLLECLQYLPSEFRSFAAEIFLSGLKSITKEAPTVILSQCSQTKGRIMLHDIGLSLGATEWVADHHQFSLSGDADLQVMSEGLEKFSTSLALDPNLIQVSDASVIENQKIMVRKIGDPLVVNENCQLSSGVNCSSSAICAEVGDIDGRQALCKEAASKIKISEEQVLHDATAIIELIRQEEFGLNSNSNKSEDLLLKRQHARLGRALHCLSQELYSQDSHFILELVQNADDNIYPDNVEPELVFILQETGIVVLNNEHGFSAENIRALCDVGNSTKKASGGGYIGKKGIGFKSVFRVTDAPEIHSNGFHVKFDITEGQIGFVLPTVISPCDTDTFKQCLYGEHYQGNAKAWNTCIILPFRSQNKERTGVSSILSMFSDLHPSLLLFLHRLCCIKFRNLLSDKLIVMRKEILCDGIVKVYHGTEVMSWLVVSKKLPPSVIRTDIMGTDISLAFTLQESDSGEYIPVLRNQPVFAYLPLRNYGLKFILQGDFVLPSSREEVDADSAWNQWLLSEFPSLFLSAERTICELPCFVENPGKAVSIYLSFVPLNGEVHGFFSQLPQMIISLLRISCCLLQDSLNLTWVLPCRVLRGWNEQARLILPDHLLQRHLGLAYLHRDVKLSDSLTMALGIRDYGPKILVEAMESVCDSPDDLKFLGINWISAWFSAVYASLSMNLSQHTSFNTEFEYDLINDLKNIRLIPLLDGSFGSVADGPIWLPCDVLNIESKGEYHPEDFPCLYSRLQIVNTQIFSVATKNEYCVGDIKPDNIMHILFKIGVRQLSAHEIIKTHILAALSNTHNSGDSELIIEYLSFIMLHLQSDCVSCHSERPEILTELRRLSVILTNHGLKCSSKEPIHFGREYGNNLNAGFLFDTDDIKWVEVDPTYLKYPSALPLPFRVKKWRDFFLDLGVTDFVQIVFADKPLEEFIFEDAMDIVNFNVSASFIRDCMSPELVNILSFFSSKHLRKKCKYFLEILDMMWDDSYSSHAKSFVISKTDGAKKPIVSSFLKSIHELSWIASTLDKNLHQPCKVYYDCEQVRSVLGILGPYAVPMVKSKVLVNDIGFKMEVSIDDALEILRFWISSKSPFVASISQMINLYTLISSGIGASSKLFKELISSRFIFIPFMNSCQSNAPASGLFLSPEEVYWKDPTGCIDKMMELKLMRSPMHDENHVLCQCLGIIYPTLNDFFVNVCGVSVAPPFSSYFNILQQLSAVALPSQAAHQVFKVLARWAGDLKAGILLPDQISELKVNFMKLENAVLPTAQDKWVSLHPSFGLICWADDDELKKQFKHFDGINFIQFGELSVEESTILAKDVATILHTIGVPALSKIVSREAILFGVEGNRDKVSLVNWVLPYAQRYLHELHFDTYSKLKQQLLEKLRRLRVIVANKLFYTYTLMGHDCASKQKFECNCVLQGNTLYASQAADAHSIFLELSRFFFDGSSELHFANFLHMVTTMAQSGSTHEQIDFFAVNSQKIPALPAGDPIWSIPSACEPEKPTTSHSIPPPSLDPEQSSKSSHRRPGISTCWPPTDWKTAPGFRHPRTRSLLPYQSNYCSPADYSKSADDAPCIENWTIEEEVSIPTTSTLAVEDSDRASAAYPDSEPPTIHIVPDDDEDEGGISGKRKHLDKIRINSILNERNKTGQLGEMLAYKYFVENLGSADTRWVNEERESGLPYDLIVGKEESRQYVEVKATKISTKDWFAITYREWKFAVEKGDAYSIAHVSISGSDKAMITVFKNPCKLCVQGDLSLSLIMPKRRS